MTDTEPADRPIGAWNDPAGLPPALRPLWIMTQKYAAQAIYVLAKLSVADLLAPGPRTADELAGQVGADPRALYRILRCAASVGVFAELPDRRFTLTPEAEGLRSGRPGTFRDLIVLHGEDITWRQYGDIMHSVRTGRPAFEKVFGKPIFDYLADHPEQEALFNRAAEQVAGPVTDGYLQAYDFGRFRRVADIGGGTGYFLGRLLQENPDGSGLLVDRPSAVEESTKVFADLGVASRARAVPGDFFDTVPAGYDAYILKSILHDWPDDRARRILRTVRRAIGDDGDARLLVLDSVLAGGNAPDHGKLLDVHMLVTFGGRERTLEEWWRLIRDGGFEPAAEPVLGTWPVLECRPNPEALP
ncbi:methyltransferase [Actinomadura rubrisoli]|uniref:O-methyltransferase n=1 Tax=Actinomadura rubrisoli TaxID=2530368 RepID=A0A4R5ACX3_9ACTN|nr:methyltransferase [Actinomadura rubrisoli]TDD68674.1 O-methyltransferase [Actinomadura rubrisoli]